MTTALLDFVKRWRREGWPDYLERIEQRGLRETGACSRVHCHGAHYTVRGGDLPQWVQDLVGDREVSGPEAPSIEYQEQVFREYSPDTPWPHALATRHDLTALDDEWPTTGILELADEARSAGVTTHLDVAFYITGVEQFGLEAWTLVLAPDAPASLVRSTHDRLLALFPDEVRMTYERQGPDGFPATPELAGDHTWTFC